MIECTVPGAEPSTHTYSRVWGGTESQSVSYQSVGPVYNNYWLGTYASTLVNKEDEFAMANKAWSDAYMASQEVIFKDYNPGDMCVRNFQVKLTEKETERISESLAVLKSYIDESKGAFLTGVWDVDTYWDTYMEELENIGINEILEVYQTAFDRFNQ